MKAPSDGEDGAARSLASARTARYMISGASSAKCDAARTEDAGNGQTNIEAISARQATLRPGLRRSNLLAIAFIFRYDPERRVDLVSMGTSDFDFLVRKSLRK